MENGLKANHALSASISQVVSGNLQEYCRTIRCFFR
jgi:hypothetical protein